MSALVARWYASGKWSAYQVQAAAARGWITDAQAAEILG